MRNEFITIPYQNGSEQIDLVSRGIEAEASFPNVNCIPIPIDAEGFITEKGVRKDVQRVRELQERGTFPQLALGNMYLQDRKNGGRFVQYDSARNENSLFLKVRGTERMLAAPNELRIVSGPCLFSVNGAKAVHADGSCTTLTMPGIELERPVEGLAIQENISLYEIETTERLTQTIGEYVNGVDIPTQVSVNIPRSEYYLYILDAFQNGLLGRDIAFEWFDAVDARSQRMRDLFVSRLRRNAPQADVRIGNISDVFGDFIRSNVGQGRLPPLEDMIGEIAFQNEIAATLVQVMQPDSYRDLNYLGYVYEEVINGVGDGIAAVAIENPTEEMIYVQAERASKQLAQNGVEVNTMGVFPYQQVMYEEEGKNLYFLKGTPSIGVVKQVLRKYR